MDILSHALAPKHEVLTDKERDEVLSNYGISAQKLPKMLASDPVAQLIQAKLGDVVRILRKSETGGESIYYRLVV